jgi:hypothetical protein
VERANNWLEQAEVRGSEISRFDSDLSAVTNLEPLFVLQQAHDAYLLGVLDAVPVLCRTALEEELTIRYLSAHGLLAHVAEGNPFKKLVDGTANATLENLIQWAAGEKPPILSAETERLAHEIQKAGNDFVHAYAMRRVGRPMTGAGNDVDGVVLDNATQLWHVKGRLEDSEGATRKFVVRMVDEHDVYDWTMSESRDEARTSEGT